MPRNVRNFWIEGYVDGNVQSFGMGPKSKDGGFDLKVKMRDEGNITVPVVISGCALDDGTLQLRISISNSKGISEVLKVETTR
jgi:hypothetical protein